MLHNKQSVKTIIGIIPLAALLVIVFLTYANEVDDLDVWWHLKSGELMYETHSIPGKDEFAFTSYVPERISTLGTETLNPSDRPSDEITRFLTSGFIKRNWLSQLLFYLAYVSGGFEGLGIFKSIIFVITFAVLYMAMIRKGAGPWSALFVLVLVAYIGKDFNYSRPQIFSYLFFALMFYALHDFKRGGRSIYFMPLLMCVWANMHGGLVLGLVIIIMFTAAEFIRYALHHVFNIKKIIPLQKGRLQTLGIICAVSAAACLISPSGYRTFLFPWIIKNSLFGSIEEYHRPMLYEYHAYWTLLLLVTISMTVSLLRRRLDLSDLFLCLTVIIPSLNSNKYIIYFSLGASTFLAYAMTAAGSYISENNTMKNVFGTSGRSEIIRGSLSILMAVFSAAVLIETTLSGDVLQFDTREGRYPVNAVKFISDNKIPGKMFNLFNWGGYIAWHLYPDYKVFIYGRAVNESAFFHYNQILTAANDSSHGIPLWKRLFDSYDINFVLTSAVDSSGRIIPLADRLYYDPDWRLVYADGTSMIFLKAEERNNDILHRHLISKEEIFEQIIRECRQGIADTPATWGFYETLGYVYMKQNRYNDALAMFGKYLQMNPYNVNVKQSYDLLKRYVKTYNTPEGIHP